MSFPAWGSPGPALVADAVSVRIWPTVPVSLAWSVIVAFAAGASVPSLQVTVVTLLAVAFVQAPPG